MVSWEDDAKLGIARSSSTGITRRRFIQGSAGLAMTTAITTHLSSSADAKRGPTAQSLPLTTWRFGGKFTDGSAAPDFDDSEYEQVTLPHCVADLSWSNWDPASWEDRWIYRHHFTPPAEFDGQRIFLTFDGVLSGAVPVLNGTELEAHLGGYLPFSYEVTDLCVDGDNVLAVAVDGRWLDVPPMGSADGTIAVDYLQPAGIYRNVALHAVPAVFIDDVFAKPVHVLSDSPSVEVECTLDGSEPLGTAATVEVRLLDGETEIASASAAPELSEPGRVTAELTLSELGDVQLWDVDNPRLYTVATSLIVGGATQHEHTSRIGFREATFEVDGFYLNGRRLKLFGLNRHQTYPYTGMAMPDRVQRRDAEILRKELNCNAVRCAHYPQSPAFMDACDELGLLVFQEIPGWQYVGDGAWQDLAVRDTEVMIRRDRNRPSVVVWGVRINESGNFPDFYARTEQLAKDLDDSRPTSGAMIGPLYSPNGFQHDVFAYNDYLHTDQVATLRPPLPDIPFYVTEAVGSLAGAPLYRHTDPADVQARQGRLHAQVHNQAASDDRYAGLVAWGAVDYQSINGGNRIYRNLKWNGVLDTFRMPKLGAAIYRAQIDPRVQPVIEPAFFWDFGPSSPGDGPGADAMICSNCERLEIYVGDTHHATVSPALGALPFLHYPPSFVDLTFAGGAPGDLRIEGYVDGEQVLTRSFSADSSGDELRLAVDDYEIAADGSDATRVTFRAVDKHGAPRPFAGGELTFTVDGPGQLVGDNPFDFAGNGGVGAVWIRGTSGKPGAVQVQASHPALGSASIEITTTN